MSIQRMHKQSDLEKRLKILTEQLHGKKESQSSVISHQSSDQLETSKIGGSTIEYPASSIQHPTSNTDITYLKTDLFKILILSTLAIGAEFLIFFSSRNNLLRIF